MNDGANQTARIAFVGDIMLGRLVSEELPRRTPESFWGGVLPLLKACDGVVANLECAITRHTRQWRQTYKVFHFGADPAAVDVLKAGNVSCVNLANNHVLDFEREGLADTLRFLDAAGIAHAGAGRDLVEARKPGRFQLGGLNLALFGCVDHEQPFAATSGHSGTNFIDPESDSAFPSCTAIAAAREQGADLVVLASHFGPNMMLHPSDAIRRYRQQAVARGVDIVQGHSAHVFQGIERIRRGLILHDTGDFLDDYAVDPLLHNDWTFVFVVDASKSGPVRLSLQPAFLEFATMRLPSEEEANAMFARMIDLSAAFGTTLARSPDGRALELVLASD